MQAMQASPEPVSDTADREIVQTRLLDAPRELVWRMFTDPEHIVQWWGPNGFTNTIHEMDVRPGGVWRFIMHGPDGTDYQNKNIYTRIEKPRLIAFEHASVPHFFCTITLDEEGTKTRLNFRMVFPTAEERDRTVREFGAAEGLNQTLGRLGEHLRIETDPSRPFVISRTFDAPRDVVWKAWTERDRLMQWFGPTGLTMAFARLDLRPGGMFHYKLQSPDGQDMWGRFVYREINPPRRLVWVNSFSDEAGNVSRHPLHLAWPLEMLTTVTFVEAGGKTTVTLEWRAINPSPQERQTFDSNHPSMLAGWTGTFDQLETYLRR
jgi:uncharacterized protein YndB with AHSA1/START domain